MMTRHASRITFLLILMSTLLLLTACQGAGSSVSTLNDASITELRAQYPLMSSDLDLVSTNNRSYKETMAHADGFVYGRIVGSPHRYSDQVSSGHDALDRKLGGGSMQDYIGYDFEVIEASQLRLKRGDRIALDTNEIFADALPELRDGMEMIFPVNEWFSDKHPTRYNFPTRGLQYVTEGGHTLSVYGEADEKALDGQGLSATLEALKALAGK